MEIDEPDVVVDRGVESTEIDYTSTASLITLGTKGTDSTEMDDESLGWRAYGLDQDDSAEASAQANNLLPHDDAPNGRSEQIAQPAPSPRDMPKYLSA